MVLKKNSRDIRLLEVLFIVSVVSKKCLHISDSRMSVLS